MFARGGAVIPMWPRRRLDHGLRPRSRRAAPVRAASRRHDHSMLQEDDGLTFAALTERATGPSSRSREPDTRCCSRRRSRATATRVRPGALRAGAARPGATPCRRCGWLCPPGGRVATPGRFELANAGTGFAVGVRRVSLTVRRPDRRSTPPLARSPPPATERTGCWTPPTTRWRARTRQLLDAARRAARPSSGWRWTRAERELGTVTWCPVGSPWRQLALRDHQAEFRMLSVAPAGRRRGVGRHWSRPAWSGPARTGCPRW